MIVGKKLSNDLTSEGSLNNCYEACRHPDQLTLIPMLKFSNIGPNRNSIISDHY